MIEKSLNHIIERMTKSVEKSQEEILHISEQAKKEYSSLEEELEETKQFAQTYIQKSAENEKKFCTYRKLLSEISKSIDHHDEQKIRELYEKTYFLQTEQTFIEREEKSLRQKRNDLENRLVQLNKTIEHAHNLGQKVSVILSFLQDDILQMNECLEDAHEEQQIGLMIIEAQEQERKRISREIHDGPAQSFANVLVQSELVELSFQEGKTEEALREMKSFRSSVQRSLQEIRRIIRNLRPVELDNLGLFPTIKKHISTVSDYSGIDIQLTIHGEEKQLQMNYEIALFRLIQEGLQNAIKHANATLIKVILEMRTQGVTLLIQDDGVGFDVDAKVDEDSYGMIGMKERIELLEGELDIRSSLGNGTMIKINLPYKKARTRV